jgi:hypothetical protein
MRKARGIQSFFVKKLAFSQNFNEFLRALGEIVVAVLGNKHHIFNTAAILAADVDARLIGYNIANLQESPCTTGG